MNKLNQNSAEQREAILKAQNGDKQALEELLWANRGLVLKKIYSLGYTNNNPDFEDMFQEGMIGLLTAIKKFDLTKGTALSTYADDWIDQRIRRTISGKTEIYIPEYQKQAMIRYKKACIKLQYTYGRIPTINEIALELNVSEEEIINLQQLLEMTTTSLNDYKYKDQDEDRHNYSEIEAQTSSEETISLEVWAENKELEDITLDLILNSNLTDEEIIILLIRNGYISLESQKNTYEEIANVLGYKTESIRFKEDMAIKKLLDNPNIVALLNRTQNPDLVLRKINVRKSLRNKESISFSNLFREYTIDEIKEAKSLLAPFDQCFLKSFLKDDVLTNYTKEDAKKLYEIINEIYNNLLSKYGRRILINHEDKNYNNTTSYKPNERHIQEMLIYLVNKLKLIQNTPKLTEEHSFYDLFVGIEKEYIEIGLRYISIEHYEFLVKKYGENFELKCNGNDTKLSSSDILSLRIIIEEIKATVRAIKKGNMPLFNIYTYFKDYDISLIDKVINGLSSANKELLHKRFGPNLKEPYPISQLGRLTAKEIIKLNKIINLIDKHLVDRSTLESINYNLNTPRNPYQLFRQYDKELITYAISKLTCTNMEVLKRIFGNNLNLDFNELKKLSFNDGDLKKYNKTIVAQIKYIFDKINNMGIDELLRQEFTKISMPKNTIKVGITGIYRLFAYTDINNLNKIINNLFDSEISILKEIFGEDFKKDDFYIDRTIFSKEKLLAIYGIINKIKKQLELEKESHSISIEEYNNVLTFINNSNVKALSKDEARDNMILFLSLGIGGVEAISNSVIAKSFNISETEVKEIIINTLTKYKEKLTGLSYTEYCPLAGVDDLKNNMILFLSLGISVINPTANKVITKSFGLYKGQINRLVEKELKRSNIEFEKIKSSFDRLVSMYDENTDNDTPVIRRYVKSK